MALYLRGAKTPDERELFDFCMEVATSAERSRLEKELRVYLEAERECKEREEKTQTGLKRVIMEFISSTWPLFYFYPLFRCGIGCLITPRGPKEGEKVRLVVYILFAGYILIVFSLQTALITSEN